MTCILVSRSIGGVFVDVVISEEHESEMELAEHPVEKGAKISDHAWRLPYRVTLESAIAGERAVASFQQLLDVQSTAEPFSLVTGLKVYQNMLIKRLIATRDKENARVLKFEAELQEVVIVSTESGGGSSSDDKAKGTVNRGQVAARPVENIPAQTDKTMSDSIAASR